MGSRLVVVAIPPSVDDEEETELGRFLMATSKLMRASFKYSVGLVVCSSAPSSVGSSSSFSEAERTRVRPWAR